jgi:hypothetical protein
MTRKMSWTRWSATARMSWERTRIWRRRLHSCRMLSYRCASSTRSRRLLRCQRAKFSSSLRTCTSDLWLSTVNRRRWEL